MTLIAEGAAALQSRNMAPARAAALMVDGLTVAPRAAPDSPIVADISLRLPAGGSLGIVGESGSGKSLTCLAVMGLLPRPLAQTHGTVALGGRTLTGLTARELTAERGRNMAIVFQDPVASLNPVRTIGRGLAGLLRLHRGLLGEPARDAAARLLESVGLSQRHLPAYPHELSGGQSQRVMMAGALTGEPSLLIADEPTTALDVTTQVQILDLIDTLRDRTGTALLIVSHDFGVIARSAEWVAVMYAGRVVETAPVRTLLRQPAHPYTEGLLASVPPEHGRARQAPLPPAATTARAGAPGCAFAPRCRHADATCRIVRPPLAPLGRGFVACHHPVAA